MLLPLQGAPSLCMGKEGVSKRTLIKNHKALTFPSQGFAMSKSFCTFRP